MQKYTVFLKPFLTISPGNRDEITNSIRILLERYSGKEIRPAEYEIEVGDDIQEVFNAWNEFKQAIDRKAFFAWYRHSNQGVTIASEPEMFADELELRLQSSPDTRLQVLQDAFRSML